MAWADPSFPYDHLALTQNFVSSPHVDKEDQSHQALTPPYIPLHPLTPQNAPELVRKLRGV